MTQKRDAVIRATNGLWFTRFEGRLSATSKPTKEAAELHLRRLQAGLVRFECLSDKLMKQPDGVGTLNPRFAQAGRRPKVHEATLYEA